MVDKTAIDDVRSLIPRAKDVPELGTPTPRNAIDANRGRAVGIEAPITGGTGTGLVSPLDVFERSVKQVVLLSGDTLEEDHIVKVRDANGFEFTLNLNLDTATKIILP